MHKKIRWVDLLSKQQDEVFPSVDLFSSTVVFFQDVSGRFLWTHVAKECLREFGSQFSHVEWPKQSSDLNPTQDLWDVLEKALVSGPTLPLSMKCIYVKVVIFTQAYWNNIYVQLVYFGCRGVIEAPHGLHWISYEGFSADGYNHYLYRVLFDNCLTSFQLCHWSAWSKKTFNRSDNWNKKFDQIFNKHWIHWQT